jgi:hypothetical protein
MTTTISHFRNGGWNMLRMAILLVTLIAVDSRLVSAQKPNVGQLGFFVGKWNGRGEMRDGPTATFKAISGGETCKWAAGGAAVVCDEKETGPGGGWEGIYTLGYDAKTDTYSLYGIENPGSVLRGTGKLRNSVWVWNAQSVANGTSSPSRFTFHSDGKSARTMLVEAQDEKGKWFTVANHRYTLTK